MVNSYLCINFSWLWNPCWCNRDPEGEVVIDISATIELASEQKPATIETSEGEIEIDVPTVELVESKQTIDEGELDFGRGEYHDISSPEAYKNSVLGKCIDLDGKWGSQCVTDLLILTINIRKMALNLWNRKR